MPTPNWNAQTPVAQVFNGSWAFVPSNPNLPIGQPQAWTNKATGQQVYGTVAPSAFGLSSDGSPFGAQASIEQVDPTTGNRTYTAMRANGQQFSYPSPTKSALEAIGTGAAVLGTAGLLGAAGGGAASGSGAPASASGTGAAGTGVAGAGASAGGAAGAASKLFSNPWLTALGIGSSLGASLIQANAAKSAAAQQQAAAQQAIGLQRDIFNQTQANLAPFRQAGAGAVGKLSDIFGLGGR